MPGYDGLLPACSGISFANVSISRKGIDGSFHKYHTNKNENMVKYLFNVKIARVRSTQQSGISYINDMPLKAKGVLIK